ncbi:hypothetical protein [Tritonibacter multivorans]|nr:hypothetical protein [Tritonibacter multivorans]MDA7419399.1 hypothetical protein [Tritonibacter multivorans]SFC68523.1 hypothetical protein SAMN04488049_103425 [Tritonibacter multivorans]
MITSMNSIYQSQYSTAPTAVQDQRMASVNSALTQTTLLLIG